MAFQNLLLVTFMITMVMYGNCNVSGGGHHHSHNNLTTKIVVSDGSNFVQRYGTHFYLNGKPLYINGFNAYWLMNMASNPYTISKVTTTFVEASRHGLNVARTWAFSDGGSFALQISPGRYNENVFKGLDFVISEARKFGIRLTLSLVNNWKDFGGKLQYNQWARERGQFIRDDDGFYTNPIVKQFYKNHVRTVLTRRNTITGLAYKDDPTIFAWELMNEPRVQNDYSGRSIQGWVREMAMYVKSIDRNHLLEVGLEGFYGESIPAKKQFNPGYQVGTDFISNNQIPQIDFATLHIYPDLWAPSSNQTAQDAFVDRWVEAHVQDSNNILRKPLLIDEFGKSSKVLGYSLAKRNFLFQRIYNLIYISASKRGACAGGLFWQLMTQGMDSYGDGYEVIFAESPSTADIIAQQSRRMSTIR